MLKSWLASQAHARLIRVLPLALLALADTASAIEARFPGTISPVTCTTTQEKRRIGLYCGIFNHLDGGSYGQLLPGNPNDQQGYAQCQQLAQNLRAQYDQMYGCRSNTIFKIDFWTYPVYEVSKKTACTDGRTEQQVTYEIGDGSGGSIEGTLVCQAPTAAIPYPSW